MTTRGRLINRNYTDPPDTDNTLWCKSRPSVFKTNPPPSDTRPEACICTKDTCGTLSAPYKASSGTDQRCTSRISFITGEEPHPKKSTRKYKQQLISTNKLVFWSRIYSLPRNKRLCSLPLDVG